MSYNSWWVAPRYLMLVDSLFFLLTLRGMAPRARLNRVTNLATAAPGQDMSVLCAAAVGPARRGVLLRVKQ